jgi:cytochrome c biogenesis protein CcmG, thiol:disulfide interchange protein DsbE
VNRWIALIPIAALLALIGVGVILLTREQAHETFSQGLIGRPGPTYTLPSLDEGEPVASAARAGRPYLINVFASWCTPCRAEHPQLMALQAGGVDIVGVAYKDRPENTMRFLTELGDPFADVGMDRDGRFGLDLGITGAPETFVIGADGSIVAVHRGPLTPEIVEETILPALQGAAPPSPAPPS